MIGARETFLVRVLVDKLVKEDFNCIFVPWNINDINKSWDGTALVCLYMDDKEYPPEDVIHYLNDKMDEDNLQMMAVGEKNDMVRLLGSIKEDLVYESFVRPINNDAFVQAVQKLFKKVDAGEFKKNILIVDDDPNYLGIVREWLREKYKVSMANSGLQAIKWLGKNTVDLILLDYEMPVTSGPQVLEMLRSDEDTKEIPVMFLTGKGDKESVMSVLELKPEGYFLKSIGKQELIEQLDVFFIKHR